MLFGKTKIIIKKGDITKEKVDIIVNAANSELIGGGGVDGAIHRAGGPCIQEECKKIRNEKGRCEAGCAVITQAGNMQAKYIIHAVGPIWKGGNKNEENILKKTYSSCLQLAKQKKAQSITFPSISCGAYSYPIDQAAPIAIYSVKNFIHTYVDFKEIRFILFSESNLKTYEYYLKKSKMEKISYPGMEE